MTGYSSETAVLKVLSVILLRIDGGDLVVLDLSAAFDTVDHHILLQPAAPGALLWHNWFGASMVPVLSGGPPPVLENWLVHFVSRGDSLWRTMHRGRSCTLLTCY